MNVYATDQPGQLVNFEGPRNHKRKAAHVPHSGTEAIHNGAHLYAEAKFANGHDRHSSSVNVGAGQFLINFE
jgi:hypothetical protein